MNLHSFLGDTPLRVAIKLVVISVLVGMAMAAFDWRPWDVWFALRDFVVNLWRHGFAALGRFGDWLILGATIVIPAFIVLRILSIGRTRP
ncbi:MAG TPA: DUF6460 domain-containing protein [Rhizobiaceae bacterium]|nr:DUF6460 domain-containing protein [Rhizobiaceae bacterium]